MKNVKLIPALAVCVLAGCASNPNKIGYTNPRQPGPAVGSKMGEHTGALLGNAAAGIVASGESAASAAAAPFNNSRRVVRTWREEVTADGRTVRVPLDIEVDQYGRPVGRPVPAK